MNAVLQRQVHSRFGTHQARQSLTAGRTHLPRWLGFLVITLASSGLWIMLARTAFELN